MISQSLISQKILDHLNGKLTQEDLAEKAKIHRTYLSDIERGARNVSLINIENLAVALDVSMAELFRIVDES